MKKRALRKDRAGAFMRLCVLLTVLGITIGTLVGQNQRLAGLRDQQQELNARLDELALEEEKRERMLDYSTTDDYIERYARDKLGLVKEGDIKFVGPSPTPVIGKPEAGDDQPPEEGGSVAEE